MTTIVKHDHHEIPVISQYTVDEALEDGTVIALSEPEGEVLPLHQIKTMDGYLMNYGQILGKNAITSLAPLHVPGRDAMPDFDLLMDLFPAQQHVVAAAVKMFDRRGSGLICGECGVGKTKIGMAAVHQHACRPKSQGGSNGTYRAIVLCPDHLVGKWCREIRETIPHAHVVRFGPQGEIKTDKPRRGAKGAKAKAEETNTRKTLRDTIALFSANQGVPRIKEIADESSAKKHEDSPVSTGPGSYHDMQPINPRSGQVLQVRKRWKKPAGPEFYVLGRNQAKWLPDWAGMADPKPGHLHAVSSKNIVVDREDAKDDSGQTMRDRNYNPITKPILGRVHYCPRCGQTLRDKRGTPLAAKDLTSAKKVEQKTCKARYLKSIWNPERPGVPGGETLYSLPSKHADKKPGTKIKHAGQDWVVMECSEPLYNYTSRPYRWAPSAIIQRKLKRMFKYLLIDELHEHKSDISGQSMACSKLIGSVEHVLGLTGTIIGGYADHLYPLMMRITPQTLREEGFEWGQSLAFSKIYGRIRTVVTTTETDDSVNVTGCVKSMRKAKSGTRAAKNYVDPGVMPTMFPRHMMGTCIFITLEELADNLPDLFEYVGGPPTAEPDYIQGETQEEHEYRMDFAKRNQAGWFDTAVAMDPEQAEEYNRIMGVMEFENKELIRKGSMKFLGAMLWTGLDYPNRPFDWGHEPDVKKAFEEARKQMLAEGDIDGAAKMELGHTVGYWEKPGSKKWHNWVGVVTPKDLDRTKVYPKEQRLIDICKQQKAEGRQSWVYVNMTGKRDILPRLQGLLENEGLKVGILRSSTCEPIDREAWIEEHGREFDVMLSHPELVKTGLDLFSKNQDGHNYPTIIFYETGYNLFTMRQAARRAWRIGQPCDCRVYYLYYKGTMQHKAMQLMSRKMAASQALEGEFSEDGLAAMAGEDNMQMALAKQLSQRISEADMQRNWGKVKSGPKKKVVSSRLDTLSPEDQEKINAATAAQILAETLEESEGKEPPIEASKEFAGVLERIAQVDRNFKLVAPTFADDEYEDAGPEKELDEETGDEHEVEEEDEERQDLDGEQDESDSGLGWDESWPVVEPGDIPTPPKDIAEQLSMPEDKCRECGKHLGYGDPALHLGICEECDTTDEPEPVTLRVVSDDEPEDEGDDFDIPELTPEILMKMFANMQANGLM